MRVKTSSAVSAAATVILAVTAVLGVVRATPPGQPWHSASSGGVVCRDCTVNEGDRDDHDRPSGEGEGSVPAPGSEVRGCDMSKVREPTVPLEDGTAVGPYKVPSCGALMVRQLSPVQVGVDVRACLEDRDGHDLDQCGTWLAVSDEWQAAVSGRRPGEYFRLEVRHDLLNAPRLLAWP